MSRFRRLFDRNTIRGKMYRLIMQMFVPVMFILLLIFAMIITRNVMFASVSGNITDASGFNQNFKNEVDLKMYLYVSGSNKDIPWQDVASARSLAEKLLKKSSES